MDSAFGAVRLLCIQAHSLISSLHFSNFSSSFDPALNFKLRTSCRFACASGVETHVTLTGVTSVGYLLRCSMSRQVYSSQHVIVCQEVRSQKPFSLASVSESKMATSSTSNAGWPMTLATRVFMRITPPAPQWSPLEHGRWSDNHRWREENIREMGHGEGAGERSCEAEGRTKGG